MNKKDLEKMDINQIKMLLASSSGQDYKLLMAEYFKRYPAVKS